MRLTKITEEIKSDDYGNETRVEEIMNTALLENRKGSILSDGCLIWIYWATCDNPREWTTFNILIWDHLKAEKNLTPTSSKSIYWS